MLGARGHKFFSQEEAGGAVSAAYLREFCGLRALQQPEPAVQRSRPVPAAQGADHAGGGAVATGDVRDALPVKSAGGAGRGVRGRGAVDRDARGVQPVWPRRGPDRRVVAPRRTKSGARRSSSRLDVNSPQLLHNQ